MWLPFWYFTAIILLQLSVLTIEIWIQLLMTDDSGICQHLHILKLTRAMKMNNISPLNVFCMHRLIKWCTKPNVLFTHRFVTFLTLEKWKRAGCIQSMQFLTPSLQGKTNQTNMTSIRSLSSPEIVPFGKIHSCGTL